MNKFTPGDLNSLENYNYILNENRKLQQQIIKMIRIIEEGINIEEHRTAYDYYERVYKLLEELKETK